MKERLLLEGAMPERALTRLAKRGVRVEKVKRLSPVKTEFIIDSRDWAKAQEAYPLRSGGAYKLSRLGKAEWFAPVLAVCKRTGILLGGLLFLLITSLSDSVVLKIQVQTDTPLKTEILRVLEENGVGLCKLYDERTADEILAQTLALDGVSFCSIKKKGSTVIVEARGSSFAKPPVRERELLAKGQGKLLSIVVVRGRALTNAGDEVQLGQVLAVAEENDFLSAFATLACVYEEKTAETDEKIALANALIAVYGEGKKILKTEVKNGEDGTTVRIEYEYSFSVN
jgi:hypothetical protein